MLQNIPQSYWISSTESTDFPSLHQDIKVDVAIVGGGLCGITTAFLLQEAGVKVAVIEARRIAERTTGHTTAKITSQHSLIYDTLISNFGHEKAKQYADANQAAIEKIASIVQQHTIDCDFSRQSAYVYTQVKKELSKIENETAAAQALGIPAYFTTQTHLPFATKGAVCFESQAQFHPRKYVLSLANILNTGSNIFETTRVLDIKEGPPHALLTDKGTVTAEQIVMASHFPMINRHGLYYLKMHTERSYILGFHVPQPQIKGMYISSEKPIRSLRTQLTDSGEMVLLAGESHKTGNKKSTLQYYKNLESFAQTIYDNPCIEYYWSTQDCMPLDNVPYIGRYSATTSGMYVATGFKKWGMTHSTAAAMIISDLILGQQNNWTEIFDPSRFTPKVSAKELFQQSVTVTGSLLSRAFSMPSEHLAEIGPEEGKIIEHNNEKIGVYKDKDNQIYAIHPVCTHMGCELAWNNSEKSWDCPCHGSRFAFTGEVIEGPTVKALEKITIHES